MGVGYKKKQNTCQVPAVETLSLFLLKLFISVILLLRWFAVAILPTKYRKCVRVCVCLHFFHTLMSLARLSRELISRPSLQACKQEITFWVSMRPGRIVRPERLPWKYWVNLGVATSPPDWRGEKTREPQGGEEK